VLAAARDLFEEVGYEATTVRMIAERAGVSVGGVFTTFSSKAHILSQVMDDRLSNLYAELEQMVPHLRGPLIDRLRSVMAVHYGFETRRLRLFVAYIAASFSWPADHGVIPLGRNVRLKTMLADALRAGMERGEVRKDADIDTFIDVLLAAYVWNYRHAFFDGAEVGDLIAKMDGQIGLLFTGVAAA
jgi:AcrR family transcriptional regulator